MKILLVDVDSKIPNLALMKISTYHKNQNDTVDIIRLNFDGYPTKKKMKIVDGMRYDIVYASCIFTVNTDAFQIINCDNVNIGGTGVSLDCDLPGHIDCLLEDYSIYPENNISYGFITRGCIRNCSFCFVPKKEGSLILYRNWKNIVKHKTVKFLDNNFLAYAEHKTILKELIDHNIRFQFNQGLDIRLIDDENACLLAKSNYLGEFIFAFDYVKMEELILDKLALFKKYAPKDWNSKFFVYVHPDMDIVEDIVYRIEVLRKTRSLPYIMRDQSCWTNSNADFYVDIAAYCNQPAIFKKMPFDIFIKKRHPKNPHRALKSSSLYSGKI